MSGQPLLQVEGVSKHFLVGRKALHAVRRVTFAVDTGQTMGIVGESGSGKSTLGRVALRLLEADEGRVMFEGRDLARLRKSELRAQRRDMQMIFQNPLAAMSPRMTVGACIEDAMVVQGLYTSEQRRRRVEELLERVGLSGSTRHVYPFELSGGQQQRVTIARALSVNPKLVVCDEPVSALDVSVQAQIIELLQELQLELGLSYLFISHNLGVVQYMCDHVMVLYLGEVVETAPSETLFATPAHPYTRALMTSILYVPESSEQRRPLSSIPGELPSPLSPPAGCPFHPRCGLAMDRCKDEKPALREVAPNHHVACHLAV